MNGILAELFALSLGVAISPVPIMGTVLLLVSPRSASASVGFAFGWISGIAVAVTGFTLLAALIPVSAAAREPADAPPVWGYLQIGLGAALIVVTLVQWLRRPRDGAAQLPRWVSAVDRLTTARAVLIGFVYSALRPKNLLIAVASGVVISAPGLSLAERIVAIAVYSVLASVTIAAPIMAYFWGNRRVEAGLETLSDWLLRYSAAVTSVAMLMLAGILLWSGLTHL
ncbi:hypothetical protein GCM10022198_11390 [Klugiella xanthotipulae]|uniref:Sap-like sulfolipid-1-addressing protein n=1 Tax=Klugiella xanthotipulae TaxID=244735 RepID=A0A543HYV4_9MICO|nr:GAP family protein [Klugiella xanthotipulae]TQM63533.1 Sap-like sulfolipid-1-addressing protein [Klugiella xanthotipulae]